MMLGVGIVLSCLGGIAWQTDWIKSVLVSSGRLIAEFDLLFDYLKLLLIAVKEVFVLYMATLLFDTRKI
jgi:hypothetical protein